MRNGGWATLLAALGGSSAADTHAGAAQPATIPATTIRRRALCAGPVLGRPHNLRAMSMRRTTPTGQKVA